MSIRSKIADTIAANTPEGGNATNRTRALLHNLISHYYPKSVLIDEATLPACSWDDATEWVYLDKANAIIVDGQVSPIHYGKRVGVVLANAIRNAGLKVFPINGEMLIPSAVASKDTVASRRLRRGSFQQAA